MTEIKDIPKGWTIASLVNDLPYIKTGVPEYKGKKKYFSTGSIKSDSIIEEGEYSFSEKPSRANRLAIKGDVLQARMKATDKAILIDAKLDGQLFSTGFFQIRPIEGKLSSNYILHYLTSIKFTQIKDELCSGSTQSALNDEGAKKIFIPIPPFEEQQAIVAKIEELLSELDNGITQLQKAQLQLKVYRQSLLKWAFEGKLTNKDLKEGELPKGWKLKELKEITSVLGDGLHGTPKYSETGNYYFINGNNLNDGKIEIKENTKRVSLEEYNKYKKPLNENTIFVSINGSLGYTAFYNNENVVLGKSACYFNVLETINKFYIRYFLTSSRFNSYANKNATGSTIKNVGLKTMRELQIPIPATIEEQQLIVEELESKLTVCDKIEETISQSLQQAEILRQSILKKAFEGKLI